MPRLTGLEIVAGVIVCLMIWGPLAVGALRYSAG